MNTIVFKRVVPQNVTKANFESWKDDDDCDNQAEDFHEEWLPQEAW